MYYMYLPVCEHLSIRLHHLAIQGIVFGKTYKLLDSGRYLSPEEQRCVENGNSFEGEEIVEGWEKMSKSKHNGVEPKVRFYLFQRIGVKHVYAVLLGLGASVWC